jgi:DNA repair protein RadA/Sms
MAENSIPKDTIFFGEIGLSGEVRPVSQQEARLKEASKLGFKTAFIPKSTKPLAIPDMTLIPLAHMGELADYLEARPKSRKAGGGHA